MRVPNVRWPILLCYVLGAAFGAAALNAQTQSKSCTLNAAKSQTESNNSVRQWCDQQSGFDSQDTGLTAHLKAFQEEFANLQITSSKAAAVYQQHVTDLQAQIAGLHAIHDKFEDMIEVYSIYLLSGGIPPQSEPVDIATMQVELAGLIAKFKVARRTPTAPAPNSPSPKPPAPDPGASVGNDGTKKIDPGTTNPPASPITSSITNPANGNGIVINATVSTAPASASQPAPGPAPATPGTPPASKTNPAPAPAPAPASPAPAPGGSNPPPGTNPAPSKKPPANPAPPPAPAPAPSPGGTGTGGSQGGAADPSPGTDSLKAGAAPQQDGTTKLPGTLTGRVVDDDNADPIAKAIVIAGCGTNGDDKYETKTAEDGQYIFASLPAETCLIRAAKPLTQQESNKATQKFQMQRIVAGYKGYPWSVIHRDLSRNYERTAHDKLSNDDKSFDERTLKSVNILGGQQTIAGDLRLPEKTSTIGEFARTIVGLQQAGASSASSEQKFFFDFWASIPALFLPHPFYSDPNFGPRFRIWGDMRVTSAPQQLTSSIGDFSIVSAIANVKVNEIAQSWEFLLGGEGRITDWGGPRMLSFGESARERFGLYWTAAYGESMPQFQNNPVNFFVNPVPGTEPDFDREIQNLGLTSQLQGKAFVGFTRDDRFKFYKEYYGGLRLKTFYYDQDTDKPLRRFPAMLDLMAGQDESMTGGRLHRSVLRIEGFFPVPYDAINYIYLFGTAKLVVGGPRSQNPIILQPATSNPPAPDPSILLIPSPQLNRDQYNIGVGIDFLQLVNEIRNRNANKPAQPAKSDSSKPQGQTPSS